MTDRYRKPSARKLEQSEILRDVELPEVDLQPRRPQRRKITKYTWLVVLNQDCDLDLDHHARHRTNPIAGRPAVKLDKTMRSILMCPAFPEDQVLAGTYLRPLVDVDAWRGSRKDALLTNRDERYHRLPSEYPLLPVSLILDFKLVITAPPAYLERWIRKNRNSRVAVLLPPFRDRLTQRFANYFTRIAEPGEE